MFQQQEEGSDQIGSIITELDLDTITMEIDNPDTGTEQNNPAETIFPDPLNNVLSEVQDAPTEVVEQTQPDKDTLEIPVSGDLPEKEITYNEPEETPSESTPTNVYASFAKANYEEGVLNDFDEAEFNELSKELGSPAKALIELNKRTIEKHVQARLESFPEEIQKLAENYQKGIPLDELIDTQSREIRLKNITDEQLLGNEDLTKQLIIEDLKNRGFTESEAGEEYKLYVESAIEDKRAVQARDRLISRQEEVIKSKAEQAQKAKEDRLQAIEESRKNLKSQVDAAKEFIPGVEVSNREKSLVFNALTKPVARDARGNELNEIMMTRAKNPVHFDTMVAYLYTKGVFNVDEKGNPAPKTEELFKGKKSETISTLEKELNSFGSQFREQGSSARIGDETPASGDHMIKHLNFQSL